MANSPGLLVHTAPTRPVVWRLLLTSTIHVKQDLNGSLVAAWDFAGGTVADDVEREAARLLAEIGSLLRLAEPVVLDAVTVGLRPEPEDGFPMVGFAGPHNLYVTVMHSGITLAPLVGRLAELEDIVGGLETGQAKLDEAIKSYERGALLKRHCEAKLKQAQAKIDRIVEAADGALGTEPFESESGEAGT